MRRERASVTADLFQTASVIEPVDQALSAGAMLLPLVPNP